MSRRARSPQKRLRAVDSQPWLDEVDAELAITDIGLFADLNVTLPANLRIRAGLRTDALAFDMEDRLASGGQQGKRDAFGFHLGPKATLMLEGQPLTWLHVTLGATYTRAVLDDSGEVLPYAPPLVSRLDMEARRGLCRLWGRRLSLFGELGVGVVGPRPLPYGEQSRTVAMLDLGAGLELSPVTLSVELFNLADVRWRDGEFVYASSFDQQDPPSLVPARHFTAGRPFTAQATLSLLF